MPRMVSAHQLIGRTIVGFEPRAQRENNQHTMHDPVIHLDDGSTLFFVAEESEDGGDYGVWIGKTARNKRQHKTR